MASSYSNTRSGDSPEVLSPLVNPSGISAWERGILNNLPMIHLGTVPSLHKDESEELYEILKHSRNLQFLSFYTL